MARLLFDSLEIRRFRVFPHLRIERLGRVNLIVGPNNVGKSCLLEALQLYANRAHPRFLWDLLQAHDQDLRTADGSTEELLSNVQKLFHGWPDLSEPVEPIKIGPIDSINKTLWLSVGFAIQNVNEMEQPMFLLLPAGRQKDVGNAIPCFSVQLGASCPILYALENSSPSQHIESKMQPIHYMMAASGSLDNQKFSELWENIASSGLQAEVSKALRILAPAVQDFRVAEKVGTRKERFPVVATSRMAEPLPLRMLGTGMQWVLTMMLALLNAQNGLLLIDEVEHGLHYSTQFELWQLIFEISQRLNVQVFATSHSWDCVVSFQQAARKSEQAEGMLIRLEPKGSEVKPTLFKEQDLAIIARDQIEVR